jgi:LysR family transcriptional regulator, carnitine catabolism transcriptional activator
MVREEIVDFGIGSDVEPDAELETITLFEDEMRAVVPASHPLRICL